MPSADTFDCKPLGMFVNEHLKRATVSVDPFARNKEWATFTNDLNPSTKAQFHLQAEEFLHLLVGQKVVADLVILDPPYSPRQISECYKELGLKVTMADTQNARFYAAVRDAALPLVPIGGIVLSFGWNSAGMGKNRGFEIEKVLMVCHGAAHNDTIAIAERRIK